MPDPIHPELNATLQAMAISFQNVGEALRELTKGQSQMLLMMQRGTEHQMDNLTVMEAQEMARRDTHEMQVDSPETGGWSPVSELTSENPNASDLP